HLRRPRPFQERDDLACNSFPSRSRLTGATRSRSGNRPGHESRLSDMNKTCDIDKLKQIFARGLVSGIGDTNQTCIEGAISLACGGDLSDSPACVANPDREFSIKINDASWSSNAARAEALLPLALAQIGTTGRDRSAWVKSVALGTIRRVLPMALRAVATISSDKHKKPLNDAADKCANAVDLSAASAASAAASDAARDARD